MSWKHSVWRAVAEAYSLLPLRPQAGLRLLCYHAVGSDLPGDPYGLSMPVDRFRRQMELVAAGRFGRPTTLGAARLDGSPELCVTFDDGYLDTLTTAAPILAALKLPFTVFVTPGLGHMTPSQLAELAAVPGCEVGAHGLTHKRLTDCSDEELARELAESRAAVPAPVMSYPHGACDRRVRDAAAAAGFTRAGCSRYGVNGPDRDPLLLCRTEIVAWDDERAFTQKLSGGWDWYALRHPDPAR